MTNDPIVIITDAIRDNRGTSAPMLARVVVDHLTDDPIVENAAGALVAAGWTTRYDNARAMAGIALRSVGGTS